MTNSQSKILLKRFIPLATKYNQRVSETVLGGREGGREGAGLTRDGNKTRWFGYPLGTEPNGSSLNP